MKTIDNLSDDSFQKVDVVLDDGSILTIHLRYLPRCQRWFASLSNRSFNARGVGICHSPNILRSFRRIINFGLMCVSIDGVDPAYIQDFVNGRCQLLVLTASDVVNIERDVMGAST